MSSPVVLGTPSRDGRTATVRCPFCRHKHVHGTPDGSAGSRISHCWDREPQQYTIVLQAAS
jgi:hypothetical protein